jgi:two-component system, LuxR family, sensor kinase FixL
MADMAGCVTPATRNDMLPGFGTGGELADLSSDSVIVFDLAGRVRYWNPASETLYGWPAIGAVGRGIAELSSNVELQVGQWQSLLQEGAWEGSVRRQTPWGGHVTATVRQTVRCDADGSPRDIVEYGRSTGIEAGQSPVPDIDFAAVSWELDISRVRPLLDAIGKRLTEGIAADPVLQPDWTDELLAGTFIVDVNERAAQLVGAHAGRAGMIGQPVGTFWPRGSRAVIAELIALVATDPNESAAPKRKLTPDGVLRAPVLTVWRSEPRAHPDRLFAVVNGATDDDRSFWYLRASEDRYRKLIHHLPSALLQVNSCRMGEVFGKLKEEGVTDLSAYLSDHPELVDFANDAVRITEANQKAVTLFGATAPADFIGPVGFLFAASPETARRVMAGRFEGKRNHTEIMKVRTFDGRMLDVQLSVTYPAPPERLDVTLLGLEDITERLRTERQLRELQANFTHAARVSMLGELATSIAHEVNQPLSAIVTNAETSLLWLARDEPNIAKVGQLTTRIVASARRASDIVQRIREMSAKRAPERVALNLREVAEEALLFVRHDLESKSIELSVDLGAKLPQVLGDRIQLQQVIVNLLVNSIQAIVQADKPVRRIEVSTRIDGESAVAFSIHDSGPGIEDVNLDQVFDSFFTTKDAGMGIGLAICHSILLAHGGSIGVSNHPEGGAQFRFSLPVLTAPGHALAPTVSDQRWANM